MKRSTSAPADILGRTLSVEASWKLDQATTSFCISGLSQLEAGQETSIAFLSTTPYLGPTELARCTVRTGVGEELTEVEREHLSKAKGSVSELPILGPPFLWVFLVPMAF